MRTLSEVMHGGKPLSRGMHGGKPLSQLQMCPNEQTAALSFHLGVWEPRILSWRQCSGETCPISCGFSKFSTLTNHLMFSLVECFLVSSGTEVLWCHCWLRSKPYRCRAMGAITGFGPPTAASCSPSTKRCSPAAGKLVLNFRTCSSVGVWCSHGCAPFLISYIYILIYKFYVKVWDCPAGSIW